MNKPLAHTALTLLLTFAALCLNACTEEELAGNDHTPAGPDVEVTLPFRLSQDIKATVSTRAEDANLARIMVFVYERETATKPASECRLRAWYQFTAPGTGDGNSTEWIPESGHTDRGKIRFTAPQGNCHIFMIGNITNAFLNFFQGMQGSDFEAELASLEDFRTKALAQWTGNMNIVNGYLPMAGKVDNADGACTIKANGHIDYTDQGGNTHTIDGNAPYEPGNTFMLERLMSKVTANITTGPGVTFTPHTYRFLRVPRYVSPDANARGEAEKLGFTDTEPVNFDTQNRNSLTAYLPENVHTATSPCTGFADREAVDKDADGQNIMHDDGHYSFTHAPLHATYLEIAGRYEGPGEDGIHSVAGDTHYFIHMGDFGPGKGFDDFSLTRNHHYTYNITVNGVNSIYAEVERDEEAPGAESIVFEGGIHVLVDAHYEQVEVRLNKSNYNEQGQVYVYADTPYGTFNCMYQPSKDGGTGTIIDNTVPRETVLQLTGWMEFAKQTGKGSLAAYPGTGNTKNILQMLDEFNSGSADEAYYTGFVNEFYYTQHPTDNSASIRLGDFVNTKNRVFSIGSQIEFSRDGKSAIAHSIYLVEQRPIATFYDLGNESVAKYGVENVDEVGRIPYGSPSSQGADLKDGRGNTLKEIGSNATTRYNSVNWTKNGWLLNADNTKLENSENSRMNQRYAHRACLSRNRDLNGNRQLEDNELRWYNPALYQVVGLWVGEPAMPADAALFTGDVMGKFNSSNNTWADGTVGRNKCPVYTSSNGENRVVWAMEGCAYGTDSNTNGGNNGTGYVHAVRNLGRTPADGSHTTSPEDFYTYNPNERTITVHLTTNALRSYSSRELVPHHERSEVNRPYRKFQVASRPYMENVGFHCGGGVFHSSHTDYLDRVRTLTANDAKNGTTTIAASYPGNGEANLPTAATWRLPNQRELAIMFMALGQDLGYGSNKDAYTAHEYSHKYNALQVKWVWVCENTSSNPLQKACLVQCRTGFSNKDYDKEPYGFVHNVITGKMTMADKGVEYGSGVNNEGYGACLPVRDVAQ